MDISLFNSYQKNKFRNEIQEQFVEQNYQSSTSQSKNGINRKIDLLSKCSYHKEQISLVQLSHNAQKSSGWKNTTEDVDYLFKEGIDPFLTKSHHLEYFNSFTRYSLTLRRDVLQYEVNNELSGQYNRKNIIKERDMFDVNSIFENENKGIIKKDDKKNIMGSKEEKNDKKSTSVMRELILNSSWSVWPLVRDNGEDSIQMDNSVESIKEQDIEMIDDNDENLTRRVKTSNKKHQKKETNRPTNTNNSNDMYIEPNGDDNVMSPDEYGSISNNKLIKKYGGFVSGMDKLKEEEKKTGRKFTRDENADNESKSSIKNTNSNRYNSYSSGRNFDPAKALASSCLNLQNDSQENNTNGKKKKRKRNKFIPPLKENLEKGEMNSQGMEDNDVNEPQKKKKKENEKKKTKKEEEAAESLKHLFPDGEIPEELQKLDAEMIRMISNDILESNLQITWDDIAGLEFAKKAVQEIVIWPMLRPDIFHGIRGPPKGLLLFGPPGTGKTLIGKAIASESGATFFSISASSLMSKWVGEGERLVRTLFAVARHFQPSVIFIDEIDSLLSQRGEGDADGVTRRIKTEFLVQLDGAATGADDRILIVGATNRPQEIDEAVRRRMVKRLYIPLPTGAARIQIVKNLLTKCQHDVKQEDLGEIEKCSEGYSGSDMKALCMEAALGPVRDIKDIRMIQANDVRPISLIDFTNAFKQIRPSVSGRDINEYIEWNKLYGSFE